MTYNDKRYRPVERILVVEDDLAVREMLKQLLSRRGYDVLAVASAEEALSTLENRHVEVDFMISDVIMAGMNGIDLAVRILTWHPTVGVLLLSGYTSESFDACRAIDAGALFVEKPVSGQRLLEAIDEVRARARRPARVSA